MTEKVTKYNPSTLNGLQHILTEDKHFATYVEALAENMEQQYKPQFTKLAENTRISLLESVVNSTGNSAAPYTVFALPLLSVFWPRCIAKDAVTVIPMDKPDILRGFLISEFIKYNPLDSSNKTFRGPAPLSASAEDRAWLDAAGGISQEPAITTDRAGTLTLPLLNALNIKTYMNLGATDSLSRGTFRISSVKVLLQDGTTQIDVPVTCTADSSSGSIYQSVNWYDTGASADDNDVLFGNLSYDTGLITLASANSKIKSATYVVSASIENNTMLSQVRFRLDQIRLTAVTRKISSQWSIEQDQDFKALYNRDLQQELLSTIGNQVATDIDRELINAIISVAGTASQTGEGHTDTFYTRPPDTFAYGEKAWYDQIMPKLTRLSAKIYTDTNMGAGNIILQNPEDAAILESTNTFSYTGTSVNGGDLGYTKGTISNGKWTTLISQNVPKGKMPMLLKPSEDIKAVWIYAPYIPATVSPYPLGGVPSMTVQSRYTQKVLRPQGLALLNIVNTQEP